MSRWFNALSGRVWAAMLAAALSSCGGGGGGGTSAALTFSPSSLTANFAAGSSATLTVRATATDPSAFSGTLYVYVVDPNRVLAGPINLSSITSTTYAATVYTSATLPTGHYTGTFQVQLCRDAQCASPLAGSPVPLPYDFTVTPAPLHATAFSSTAGTVHQGGSLVSSVNVGVSGPDLAWTATTAASWLQIDKPSGTGPAAFNVSYATSSLAVGSYSDKVTVRTSDGQSVDVPFTLDVLPTQFVITSGIPSFAAVNGAPIASQSLSFDLDNGVASPWTASSSAAWMVASATSGTTPATLLLLPDPSRGPLASGSYSANIVLASPGISNRTVISSVNLTKATLSAPVTSITLGGVSGRDMDTTQSAMISLNTGTQAWPWSLSTLPSWLSTTSASGSVSQSGATVNLAPKLAAVSPGSVSSTVTVTAKVNGDDVTLPLTVNLNADQRRLLVSDWGVGLADTPTGSVLTRSITVSDNFGHAIPWSAVSDSAWLVVTASGTTSAGSMLTLTANDAALPNDTISIANVTVSSSIAGVSPAVIRVGLWKSASGLASIRSLPVTSTSIVADKTRPYIYANNNGSTIDVYHAYTAQKVGSITGVAPALGRMAVSADGSRLFAVDTTNGAIAVVNLTTWTKIASWTMDYAATPTTPLLAIRPNGVDVVLVGNGLAYSEGRSLGLTGIGGLLTASGDGRHVYAQDTIAAPSSVDSYDIDYSEISGGILMVSHRASGSFSGAYGRDIAASPDGTRLYLGTAPPYVCASVAPSTLRLIGGLPGVQDIYLNNIEVASDGRTVCAGVSLSNTNIIEVHAIDGTLLNTFSFSAAGLNGGLKNQQMMLSPDGLVAVGLTGDPLMVFVPIGP